MPATVVAAAGNSPADRYVVFGLRPTEVRSNRYDGVTLPERPRWRADGDGGPAQQVETR